MIIRIRVSLHVPLQPPPTQTSVLNYYCNWVQTILPNKSSHVLETIAAVGSHSLCCNISTSGEEWCLERSARLLMGLRALFMARRHGDPLHKAREGLIDQLDGGGVLFPFPRVRLLVWALLSVDMAGSEGCAPRVIRDVFSDQNMWCQHETVFANLFYFRNVTHCRVKQDIWWETIVIWDCFYVC